MSCIYCQTPQLCANNGACEAQVREFMARDPKVVDLPPDAVRVVHNVPSLPNCTKSQTHGHADGDGIHQPSGAFIDYPHDWRRDAREMGK